MVLCAGGAPLASPSTTMSPVHMRRGCASFAVKVDQCISIRGSVEATPESGARCDLSFWKIQNVIKLPSRRKRQGEAMSLIGRLVTQLSCGPRSYGYSRLGNSTPAAGGYGSASSVQPAVGSGGLGFAVQPSTTPASYDGDPPLPLSGAGIAVSSGASSPSGGVVASDTGGLGVASVPAAPL